MKDTWRMIIHKRSNMKRSEMLRRLQMSVRATLAGQLESKPEGLNLTELASNLLYMIEDGGMLPPKQGRALDSCTDFLQWEEE